MSFQPFAVQCLTCGSRLRVTDPAIVGTIAACPKCNSMVQIDPAVDQVAVGQSGVDSQAITEDAIATNDESQSFGDETDTRGFAGSESIEPPPPVGSAIPPEWQSEGTRRSRQIALVVALSLSGLLTAVAIFSWFVRSRQRPATAQADVRTDDDPAAVPVNVQPSVEQPSTEEPSTEEPSTEEPSIEEPSTEEPHVAELSDAEPNASDPATVDSAMLDTPAQETPTPPDGAPIPNDLMPQSPIIEPTKADPEPPAESMQELPPGLQKYLRLLPDAGVIEAPTLTAPPTMDEITIDAAAEAGDDPLVSSKPKVLNLQADLAIPMALDTNGYRLADLLLLVSQITGVPIQVDWVSFDLAGIDIDATVPTSKGLQSARQLLDVTAASLGAEIREEESLVVFTLSDATFETTMASVADLTDFGGDKKSAVSVLNEFLSGNGQANELNTGASRGEQQLAGLAIESLRRMRGIVPKTDDRRFRRWAQSAEQGAAGWPPLAAGDPLPQLDSPITIAGFLRRTARRNQASCVFNWYDANRRAVAPELLVLPHVGEDAAATLEKTLSPLQLQVRKVDDQHWWVGTEATYDRLNVVVWTAPLGESRDSFVQSITSIMNGASRDVFRTVIDNQSDRALLLLPRYIVRQLPKIAPAIAAK